MKPPGGLDFGREPTHELKWSANSEESIGGLEAVLQPSAPRRSDPTRWNIPANVIRQDNPIEVEVIQIARPEVAGRRSTRHDHVSWLPRKHTSYWSRTFSLQKAQGIAGSVFNNRPHIGLLRVLGFNHRTDDMDHSRLSQ